MTKKPIETAPKDGTWIIVSGGRTNEDFYKFDEPPADIRRPVVARWDPDGFADILMPDGEYERQTGAWVFGYWDGQWYSVYIDPTHWQPLNEG